MNNMHLNIFVSQRCFLYCKGCYSYSREETCGQMLESGIILNFLKYANKNGGVKKVTICGGDPLTRPDIIDLLRQIKNIGYYISLDTLGTSILKDVKIDSNLIIKKTDVKELAKYVDMIGIPLDGSTDKTFKMFRPTQENIVEQQIKICDELHKNGVDICINSVLHKGNLDDIVEIGKTIESLGYIKKWQIFQFEPFGKYGKLNKDIFEISQKDFLNVKQKIKIKDIDVQFKCSELKNKAYILIDNSGDAYVPPTRSLKTNERKIIGNIKEEKDWPKIISYLKKD